MTDFPKAPSPPPRATRFTPIEGSPSVDGGSDLIGVPLHVSLNDEDRQLVTPPPGFEAILTTRQEQAVSAINRDVVELVGRQKVALNDVLEENQRLQIRYNNLVGQYDTWQKQVTLHAERELAHKLSSSRELLASKYDEALAERTRKFTAESAQLRREDEKLHNELMRAKEAHMRMLGQQVEEVRGAV